MQGSWAPVRLFGVVVSPGEQKKKSGPGPCKEFRERKKKVCVEVWWLAERQAGVCRNRLCHRIRRDEVVIQLFLRHRSVDFVPAGGSLGRNEQVPVTKKEERRVEDDPAAPLSWFCHPVDRYVEPDRARWKLVAGNTAKTASRLVSAGRRARLGLGHTHPALPDPVHDAFLSPPPAATQDSGGWSVSSGQQSGWRHANGARV